MFRFLSAVDLAGPIRHDSYLCYVAFYKYSQSTNHAYRIMHNIYKSLYFLVQLKFLKNLYKYLLIVTFSYTLTFLKAVVDQPTFPGFTRDTSL